MKPTNPRLAKKHTKAPKKTLGEFIIENQNQFGYSTGELSRLLNAIKLASKAVNHEVNKAGLVDIIGSTNQINHSNEEQQKIKTKIADFCYSIKAVHKFVDENGKKMVGVYIILDKPEQLNQPFFIKTLQDIIEMSEKTNRFLIKAF